MIRQKLNIKNLLNTEQTHSSTAESNTHLVRWQKVNLYSCISEEDIKLTTNSRKETSKKRFGSR